MKKLLPIILLTWALATAAQKPTEKQCRAVAKQWIIENKGDTLRCQIYKGDYDTTYRYIYTLGNVDNGAWVIVRRSFKLQPVFGYNIQGKVLVDKSKANEFAAMLRKDDTVVLNSWRLTIPNHSNWARLLQGKKLVSAISTPIAPLVKAKWNQSPSVNDSCPKEIASGKLSITGCGATAQAQILKYWNYAVGTGIYTYTPYGFPTQYVDFSKANYNFAAMPLTNSKSPELAQLMLHCGVAQGMQYGVYSSGSYPTGTPSIQQSYKYFNYKIPVHLLQSKFSVFAWDSILTAEYLAGRPVQYYGFDGGAGHTFVLHGKDANAYHAVNWGYGGYGDGYFSLNSLTVSGYNFSANAGAFIYIMPNTANPTSPCASPTISTANVTKNSAIVTLNNLPAHTSTLFQYKKSTETTWATIQGLSATLTSLSPNTTYNLRGQGTCAVGQSDFIQVNIKTQPDCSTPVIANTIIDSTKATAIWNAVPGATSYRVNYSFSPIQNGLFASTNTTVSNPSFVLAPLTPESKNWWRVQAICGTNGESVFTDTVKYATKSSTVTPPPPLVDTAKSVCAFVGNTKYEFIQSITINNTTSNTGNNSGAFNGGSFELRPSNAYMFVPGYTGLQYTESWNIYIDYNKNGVFETGERIDVVRGRAVSGAFLVKPFTGTTKMRVIMQYGSYASNPCKVSSGEGETYSVTYNSAVLGVGVRE